jgi:CheY-like chemotaxis protein
MPGMDGYELIDRVRANELHAGTPIVVITGSTDPHVSDRLRQRGVNAVFAKPYSPVLVREKLEQLLRDEMQLD